MFIVIYELYNVQITLSKMEINYNDRIIVYFNMHVSVGTHCVSH